jgi:hypothetical protein
MNQIAFKRIFTDNRKYGESKLLYMDSLAYIVQEYLYVNGKAVFGDCNFYMGDTIMLYDFMTLTYYFIQASRTEFGKTEIKEYISGLFNIRHARSHDIVEYKDNHLLVSWASYELIMSILWAAWIYAKVRCPDNKEKTWESARKQLYSLMTEYFENRYNRLKYFEEKTPVAIANDAVMAMVKHIVEKKQDTTPSQSKETKPAKEEFSKLQAELDALKKENEALKTEIKSLKEQQEDEASSEEIEWHDKVRLDALLRLMQENGADLEKYGNKKKAAEVMQVISGLPLTTCKNYCTNRDLSLTHHEEEILKLNSILQALDMKIRL